MYKQLLSTRMYAPRLVAITLATLAMLASTLQPVAAQQPGVISEPGFRQPGNSSVHFRVNGPSERLEMVVNSSRILTLGHKVPRMLVNNPEIVRATPLAPNQIQLSASNPGVTQLNVWDENEKVYTIDVIVMGDSRELQMLLQAEFPDAALTVRPLASSVVIGGYVPSAGMVGQIVRIAQDYYPNVINNMRVGGVQTVLLHTKVMEVSRTKLRKLGVDFAEFNGNDALVSGVSGLIQQYTISPPSVSTGFSETLALGLLTGNNQLLMFIEALRQHNLVKLLAEPTLVTTSGRPASFNSGGEFPIVVPQSLGSVSIEYRSFGTRVDYVPIVLGNGRMRLEVRPQVSEIDPARSVNIQNINVPGLRTRWVDTAVEMRAGQTLALAGLIQNRVEASNRGIPVLADIPWAGSLFRRVEEQVNEVELVILVTPEIVDAMDCHQVPPCGPGQLTTSPSNHDLYGRGFLEVPKCCPDGTCHSCQAAGPVAGQHIEQHEVVPNTRTAPAPPTAPEARRFAPRTSQQPRTASRYNRPAPQPTRRSPSTRQSAPVVRQAVQNPSVRYQSNPASSKRPVQQDQEEPNLLGPIGYDEIK